MTQLDLPQDYVDLLVELHDAAVEFVLLGGWAVAVHGHGRATDDLDILVRPTPENAMRVVLALQRFGAPLEAHGVTAELFSKPLYGYRIGIKPVLIELLTSVSGIDFDQAAHEQVTVEIEGRAISVIGKQALLANKRAAGRLKDLADVEALESESNDPRD
ncbi:MAG: hypothetical protein RL701_3748 [Pseudomonadota bacterium]|jgi:hypothetical protein